MQVEEDETVNNMTLGGNRHKKCEIMHMNNSEEMRVSSNYAILMLTKNSCNNF